MVSTANRPSSIGRPGGHARVSRPTSRALAAGHSSQPVPVATSTARKMAATASQTQNGCVA
jgi:hypothetical protein